MGFYPATAVDPFNNIFTAQGVFKENGGSAFDVSISVAINGDQLSTMISGIKTFPSTYDLNSRNCTDFGIQIAKIAGINLPSAYGTWPKGGGDNPGQLGQNVRKMPTPPNAIKNVNGGNALSSIGGCN